MALVVLFLVVAFFVFLGGAWMALTGAHMPVDHPEGTTMLAWGTGAMIVGGFVLASAGSVLLP